jgi:hypothetical protein
MDLEQPMHARALEDLDLLSTKLRRVQTDYERARSRDDVERIDHFRLQMNAIVAERARLIRIPVERRLP